MRLGARAIGLVKMERGGGGERRGGEREGRGRGGEREEERRGEERKGYLDGHDPCYDGDVDPYLPTVAMKLHKGLRLEEKLSDNEVSTSVNLLL